jgi:YHS domain-containing protein
MPHHPLPRAARLVLVLLALVAPLVAPLAAPLPAHAAPLEPVNKSRWDGLALDGYDPVAYFDEEKAVEGSEDFSFEWQGATWRFASAERRDRFAAEPERYAPQFGGYCAWAVGHGYTADADPQAWSIVDSKLYLNYNGDVQAEWTADRDNQITKAHANWPKLLAGERIED